MNIPPNFIVEPEKICLKSLRNNLSNYKKDIFNLTLEDFVKTKPDYHESCNLAITSHTLYYSMDSREQIFDWLSSFFKIIVPGGIGLIIHQSITGDMYEFFNKFADDRLKLLPEEFINKHIEKEKEFTITIKCNNFNDFLEIGYFLLIDPKCEFKNQQDEIEQFLKTRYYNKKEDNYIMKQSQKLYQIRVPN